MTAHPQLHSQPLPIHTPKDQRLSIAQVWSSIFQKGSEITKCMNFDSHLLVFGEEEGKKKKERS